MYMNKTQIKYTVDNKRGIIMESLMDDETKIALDKMGLPLKNRIEKSQKLVSDTLRMLEVLQLSLLRKSQIN